MALTNAQRQARYRAKLRAARNVTVLDDNGNPNSSLTRIARNLAEGMNPSRALVEAGSSINARTMIAKAREGLAAALKVRGAGVAELIDHAVEDLRATKPMQLVDKCIDVADSTRRVSARRDLLELNDRAGELPAIQTQATGGTTINVQVIQFGQVPLSEVGSDSDG